MKTRKQPKKNEQKRKSLFFDTGLSSSRGCNTNGGDKTGGNSGGRGRGGLIMNLGSFRLVLDKLM